MKELKLVAADLIELFQKANRNARHAKGPWESFQYSYLGMRSEYEPTRFTIEFVAHDERYRVVVAGTNLEKMYTHCIQHRLEWIRAAVRPGFAADGEPVVEKVKVVKIEEKRGVAPRIVSWPKRKPETILGGRKPSGGTCSSTSIGRSKCFSARPPCCAPCSAA